VVAVADEHSTLPRGRHKLTREQVATSQRDRLLLGMADAVAERGYARTTVADVLKRVHVSRETFYQHFADKEACFLATMDRAAEVLLLAMAARLPGAGAAPLDRFDRTLDTYLTTLTTESAAATVVLLESLAAGDAARRRRFDVQERFVLAVAANFADDPAWQRLPDPTFAARTLVGGISSMVTSALATDHAANLRDLHAPIMALLRALTAAAG
jgi:AcrR family transcriptional regulator